MKIPHIVIVGHVCIDRNESEHVRYTSWGSTALYMAQYFQDSLGITPNVITRYGQDFLPYAKGFSLFPRHPQERQTQVNGNMPHGSGRIFQTFYSENSGPPELTAELQRLIATADILILAPLLANYPAAFVQQVVALAPPSCLKVLTLQGYLRGVGPHDTLEPREFTEASDILPLLNVVIFSEEDHPRAVAMASDWARQYPLTKFVVTAGPKGATVITNAERTAVPTAPVPPAKILDSVGCGDVFAAACTYALFCQPGQLLAATRVAHTAARQKLFASAASRQ